jgi:hypothetical protein
VLLEPFGREGIETAARELLHDQHIESAEFGINQVAMAATVSSTGKRRIFPALCKLLRANTRLASLVIWGNNLNDKVPHRRARHARQRRQAAHFSCVRRSRLCRLLPKSRPRSSTTQACGVYRCTTTRSATRACRRWLVRQRHSAANRLLRSRDTRVHLRGTRRQQDTDGAGHQVPVSERAPRWP